MSEEEFEQMPARISRLDRVRALLEQRLDSEDE